MWLELDNVIWTKYQDVWLIFVVSLIDETISRKHHVVYVVRKCTEEFETLFICTARRFFLVFYPLHITVISFHLYKLLAIAGILPKCCWPQSMNTIKENMILYICQLISRCEFFDWYFTVAATI